MMEHRIAHTVLFLIVLLGDLPETIAERTISTTDRGIKADIAYMMEKGMSANQAVEKALQEIKTAGKGGQLYFPGGAYTLSRKIAIRPHDGQPIAVYGDGPGVTTLHFKSGEGIDFKHIATTPWDHSQSPFILRDLTIAKDGKDAPTPHWEAYNSTGIGAAVRLERGVKNGNLNSLSGGQFSSYITNVHVGSTLGNIAKWHQGFHFRGGAVFMTNVMCYGGHFLDQNGPKHNLPFEGNSGIFIHPGAATSFRYHFTNLYLERWRDGIIFRSVSEQLRIEGVYITNMEMVGVHNGFHVVGLGGLVGLQVANSHMDFAYAGFLTQWNAVNWKLTGNYFTQNCNGYNNAKKRAALTGGVGLWVKGMLFQCHVVGNTFETIRERSECSKAARGDVGVIANETKSSFVYLNTFTGWKHGNKYGAVHDPKKCKLQK